MADEAREPRKEPLEKSSGASKKKAALIVVVACVGIVAAVVLMNMDRLPVNSDESDAADVTPTANPNTAPVILSVTPATDRIQPSDACEVTSEVTDDDGDTLTYIWEASKGEVLGEGPRIEWVAPDTEGLFKLSLTVEDERGETAEYSTSLSVKANYAPEISELSASKDTVPPSESTHLSCSASDADGDKMTYQWTATNGELFGEGDAVVWLAPEETGAYWVEVAVTDAYGAEAVRAMPINVAERQGPDLGRFKVKGVNTDMLDFSEGVWDIFRGRSCSIECVVLEGEGPFTYEWSVDYGKLAADGAMATWEAPNEKGPATIVVEVTDIHGNTTTGSVLMYVETCTCRF